MQDTLRDRERTLLCIASSARTRAPRLRRRRSPARILRSRRPPMRATPAARLGWSGLCCGIVFPGLSPFEGQGARDNEISLRISSRAPSAGSLRKFPFQINVHFVQPSYPFKLLRKQAHQRNARLGGAKKLAQCSFFAPPFYRCFSAQKSGLKNVCAEKRRARYARQRVSPKKIAEEKNYARASGCISFGNLHRQVCPLHFSFFSCSALALLGVIGSPSPLVLLLTAMG